MAQQFVDRGLATSAARTPASARARGRIVEIRVGRLANTADVECLRADVQAAIRCAGSGATICADYRGASPLSRQVASAWSRDMRSENASIARSAALLNPSNTMFNLQVQRIVRCACSPTRRLFADRDALRDWLDAELTPSERDGLAAFLSEDEC